jgi:S-(hydroxymethyl)glutathione dehydrogenase/alcohol dehydrogenase
MQAAVLHGPSQPLVVEEVDLEGPRAGEVRVRVMATGLCHSDLHYLEGHRDGPYPMIMGHEGAGVIEAVGPGVAGLAAGDHVVLSFRPNCGRCAHCLRGESVICDGHTGPRQMMHDGTARASLRGTPLYVFTRLGTFAEHLVCPAEQAVPIRRDVPWEVAALIGCSVTTGVCAVTNAAGVRAGDSVAVIGCGGVGLNAVQGARLVGAGQIIAVDTLDNKLDYARAFGATHTVNARREEVVAAVRELSGGGVDYAFEVIGLPSTIEQAVACIRPGGKAVVVGMTPLGATVQVDAYPLVFQQKTLMGTSYGNAHPPRDIPRIADLYRAGRLDLDALVSRRYGLGQINEGFAALKGGEVARGVVAFA